MDLYALLLMVKPQYGHEKFSENCNILSPITSTATLPLVNLKAASSESNNLDRIPSFNTIRSTTTLISCFLFLSNSISSSTSWVSPSTIMRTNPSFFTFSMIFYDYYGQESERLFVLMMVMK